MTNTEIASIFRDIADLLSKKKESWFKIRAYRQAADSIEGFPESIGQMAVEGRLRDVPGVGEAIAKKITELVRTGRMEFYEKLKGEYTEVTG
jgi:DNA polymerase (family 10)